LQEGFIVKINFEQYFLKIKDKIITATLRKKIRFQNDDLVVGDKVIVDGNLKTIEKLKERVNKLDRPLVANIDCALIITSVKEPDLSFYLLDKLLTLISLKKIKPIICFSKIDLLNKEELKELEEIKSYYQKYYSVYYNTELERLKNCLKNKIVVITGQTGVGKSTLLNRLNPDLNLETNPISKALNRGVHTTRIVEVHEIDGIFFVDTPGFSALDLQSIDLSLLKDAFLEFANIECKYKDCNHDLEANCEVKRQVDAGIIRKSRYENYLQFKKEIYENRSQLYK